MSLTTSPGTISVDPPCGVVFSGVSTEVATTHLKLSNPSDQRLCFKIKTTAPEHYCVQPNKGFLSADEEIVIMVTLQPFNRNSSEEKQKHKFAINSTPVAPGEMSVDNVWNRTPMDQVMITKLKVSFDEIDTASMNSAQSQLQQQPRKPVMSSATGGCSANLEAENRKLVDEMKRLQSQLQQSQSEYSQLKERASRLEQLALSRASDPSATTQASPGSSISFVHVIIVAVIALILGLIGGKVV